MSEHPNLRLLDHPLADILLTRLRDKDTPEPAFQDTLDRLSHLVAAEAARHVATGELAVTTPLGPFAGRCLAERIVLVPILRAGMALLPGFRTLFPDAPVGMLGVCRNEETLEPMPYLEKLPKLNGQRLFILDPMLATGGSAAYTIAHCRAAGAGPMVLVSILAAPEGVRYLEAQATDVPVLTVGLDTHLNEHGYIVPGLGDAGDRYFGA